VAGAHKINSSSTVCGKSYYVTVRSTTLVAVGRDFRCRSPMQQQVPDFGVQIRLRVVAFSSALVLRRKASGVDNFGTDGLWSRTPYFQYTEQGGGNGQVPWLPRLATAVSQCTDILADLLRVPTRIKSPMPHVILAITTGGFVKSKAQKRVLF
jgi:hypothetical protein